MFELALWQIHMLVIPIPETISRDQRTNAYAMAGKGVAIVLEEDNLGKTLVLSEIERVLKNRETYEKMSHAGLQFESSREAAATIARELIRIGLSHQ